MEVRRKREIFDNFFSEINLGSSILLKVFMYYHLSKLIQIQMSIYDQHQLRSRASFPVYHKNPYFQVPNNQVDEDDNDGEKSNQVVNQVDKKADKNQIMKWKSTSKILNTELEQRANWPQFRAAESVYQDQAAVDWIKKQLTKIGERITRNQSSIEQLSADFREMEQKSNCSSILPNPHYQEINKILSLVEKTQNRSDYRRTTKMIEQLRSCILECHMDLKNIKYEHQEQKKEKKKISGINIQNLADELKKINDRIQMESREFSTKIQLMDDRFNKWGHEQVGKENNLIVGERMFEGKMITLHYEEKISTHNNQQRRTDNTIRSKFSFKQRTLAEDPQKDDVTVVLTSKTYYLDNEGYLLDKNKHYLLNCNNQRIQLTNKEIELLKQEDLL